MLEDDALLLECLGSVESMQEAHVALSALLSGGFIDLHKSKRAIGSTYTSASDMRLDIDPCICLNGSLDQVVALSPSSEAMVLVMVLPNAPMRSAQKKFIAALDVIVTLAELARKVNGACTQSEIIDATEGNEDVRHVAEDVDT